MEQEKILCACVLIQGNIAVFGKRHGDAIFIAQNVYGCESVPADKQGFRTSKKRFLDRKQALKLALRGRQIKRLDEQGKPISYLDRDELYSEDLR